MQRSYNIRRLIDLPYWQTYGQQLLDRIDTANPEYDFSAVKVLFSPSLHANAAAYGQGLITINLGFFHYLSTEDELAFVLCHELAHQYLDHVHTRMISTLDHLYSKETQAKLRKLKRQAFNTMDSLRDVAMDYSFGYAKHTRYGEAEADSLGLILYLNSGFSKTGPLSLMTNVLPHADTTYHDSVLDFRGLLHTDLLPFKDRWLEVPPPSPFAKVEYLSRADKDSLKTHPDTDVRYARLLEALQTSPTTPTLDSSIANRRRSAAINYLAYSFNIGSLARTLYEGFHLLETPDSVWAKGIIALSLYRIAVAREERRFVKHVPLPRTNTFDEGYTTLLQLLHNMRASELKTLAHAYSSMHGHDFANCGEEMALARLLSLRFTEGNQQEAKLLREAFEKNFPKSTYKSLLRDQGDPWKTE